MKQTLLIAIAAATMLTSCGTYTATGAYAGAQLGNVLGSAIGGISGGWRGHGVGTIIGTVGGAVAGAAIGQAAENKREAKYEAARERVEQRYSQQSQSNQYQYNTQQGYDNSGFDPTNSADDRIYDYNDAAYTSNYSAAQPKTISVAQMSEYTRNKGFAFHLNNTIEVSNVRLIDDNQDGQLEAGENGKVIFEIRNNSDQTIYDIQPMVAEVSGNKHVHISPNIHVESIAPHKGIRYTATIKADKRVKNSQAVIQVAVGQGNSKIVSQAQEITIPTVKR